MKPMLLLAAALLVAPALRAQEDAKQAAPTEAKAEEPKAEEPAQEAAPAPKAEEPAAPAEVAPKVEEKAATEKKPTPEKKAAPEKKAQHEGKGGKKAGAGDRAHVDAALAFLKAYAYTGRKGEQGAKAWEALHEHAGEKVSVKIAGKEHDLDVAGKKSDARLLKFSKLETWREGDQIKGVNVGLLEFKVGKDEHKGKGRVAMSEKDGKWMVDAVEAD